MLTLEALKAELLLTMKAIAISTPITPEDEIIRCVCKVLEVDTADLVTPNRCEEYADARFIIFQLLREHTQLSFKRIGQLFNRDYSTVLYGVKKFKELYDSNHKPFLSKLKKVTDELGMDFFNPDKYG